jgi:hypothetical protein
MVPLPTIPARLINKAKQENVNIKGELWKKVWSRGVIDTAESNFGYFRIDFLGEYAASDRESGP